NTQSIGINYRQDFNDKLTMYGDYSFGHSDNTTLSNRWEEIFAPDVNTYTTSNTNNGSIGNDHRFSWNIEYKPDSRNYIKLSPNLTYRQNRADNLAINTNKLGEQLVNDVTNRQFNRSNAPNYGVSGL